LFGKDYDQALYTEVVKATELEQEIHQLPGKDSFHVGPDGMLLSGGQRQRLSLARALYQNADVYILDDILSSGIHFFHYTQLF